MSNEPAEFNLVSLARQKPAENSGNSCCAPAVAEETSSGSCCAPAVAEETSSGSCCAPAVAEETSSSSCCAPAVAEESSSGSCCAPAVAEETSSGSCCAPPALPKLQIASLAETSEQPHWASGHWPANSQIWQVKTSWSWRDWWGALLARTSHYRDHYRLRPGLYAVGQPDANSEVLVTANYKLSFDHLRRHLSGLNLWLLVLDTNGINVWCAAGKGTFGTEELLGQIGKSGLAGLLAHRRLVLPQLGAVGVNAKAVQNASGFRVYFGPVYARDLPAYLHNNLKKTDEMKRIHFTMKERLVLTPMELLPAVKKTPLFVLGILLYSGFYPEGIIFKAAWYNSISFLLHTAAAVFAGAFFTPLFLPFVPFRSFALKGWLSGLMAAFLLDQWLLPRLFYSIDSMSLPNLWMQTAAIYLFFPAASAWFALQFTGSSTYTNMSGVRKEMKYTLPAFAVASVVSLLLMLAAKLQILEII